MADRGSYGGSYFTEGTVVYRDIEDSIPLLVGICVDENAAELVAEALNHVDEDKLDEDGEEYVTDDDDDDDDIVYDDDDDDSN